MYSAKISVFHGLLVRCDGCLHAAVSHGVATLCCQSQLCQSEATPYMTSHFLFLLRCSATGAQELQHSNQITTLGYNDAIINVRLSLSVCLSFCLSVHLCTACAEPTLSLHTIRPPFLCPGLTTGKPGIPRSVCSLTGHTQGRWTSEGLVCGHMW